MYIYIYMYICIYIYIYIIATYTFNNLYYRYVQLSLRLSLRTLLVYVAIFFSDSFFGFLVLTVSKPQCVFMKSGMLITKNI